MSEPRPWTESEFVNESDDGQQYRPEEQRYFDGWQDAAEHIGEKAAARGLIIPDRDPVNELCYFWQHCWRAYAQGDPETITVDSHVYRSLEEKMRAVIRAARGTDGGG